MAHFGIFWFPTGFVLAGVYEPDDRTTGPRAIGAPELARAVEERGFEALFVPEHTHIPTPRRTVWAGGPRLPAEYWHTFDPFVVLSAAAAVTTCIRLGTGIAIVPQRDPFTLAKQAASLDWLSSGRLLLGIGSGWNVEEMADHGVAFETRWRLTRTRARHACHLDVEPRRVSRESRRLRPDARVPEADSAQRTARADGGAVELGAPACRRVLRRLMPILVPELMEPGDSVVELRRLAEEAGRAFSSISLSCYAFGALGGPPPDDFLRRLVDLGFERLVLRLPAVARDDALRGLDTLAAIAARFE